MNRNKQKISFGKIQLKVSNEEKISNELEEKLDISTGFGKFSKKCEIDDQSCKTDEDTAEMTRVMGFESFGQKKAKNFDVREMIKQAIVNNQNKRIEEQPAEKSGSSDSESDSEIIGPPVPQEMKQNLEKEVNETNKVGKKR